MIDQGTPLRPMTRVDFIWRGVCGRCPKCGQGKLFKSYLKQVDMCSVCHEDFSHIRADDGPAWLTILLTAHILMPFAIYLSMHNTLPQWAALTFLFFITVLAVSLLLPRTKGLFIAVIWLLAQKKSASNLS